MTYDALLSYCSTIGTILYISWGIACARYHVSIEGSCHDDPVVLILITVFWPLYVGQHFITKIINKTF